jgi:hypothetical protein
MDPSGITAVEFVNSPFWGMPYALCLLAMAAACWAGCYHIAQEIFKTKPAKIVALLILLFMCAVVAFVNPATPDRVKNAMAKQDLIELIWDWKRGDRVAVEKRLSDPKIQKFYEE